MGTLRDRVEAELESVERALVALPNGQPCSQLSTLELAGVAALLHSFYNGVENILKQIVVAHGSDLPQGDSWHRELVDLAVSTELIRQSTADALRPYLAFRSSSMPTPLTCSPNASSPLSTGPAVFSTPYAWTPENTSRVLPDLPSYRLCR